jgi:hypothetical protein
MEDYSEATSRGFDTNIVSGRRVERITLPFHKLDERHPGVTAAIGNGYTEAARVCLDRHHISPIVIVIRWPRSSAPEVREVLAVWQETTQRERNAWGNATDATEAGAYGFALAAVEIEGLVAVRRAETGTGADYYISPPGVAADDLEDCVRLEVSGVDRGDERAVDLRLRQKIQQALSGSSSLPAIAAVVGFRSRIVALDRADEA